jgi:hypothetical protein
VRRDKAYFTCDAPRCDNRWSGDPRFYLEAGGSQLALPPLDFCSWKCLTVYAMRAEHEEASELDVG